MHDDHDDLWQWLRAVVPSIVGWLARRLIKLALARVWTWLTRIVAGHSTVWWSKVASVPIVFVVSFLATWELREFTSYETVVPYRTSAELPQTYVLSDGSRLVVDAHSDVVVRMTHWSRELDVRSGRVQLDVAPGWRPLAVCAVGTKLDHFGTSFMVQNYLGKEEPTIVTVESGRLHVGERCSGGAGGEHIELNVTAGYQAVIPSPSTDGSPELRALSRNELTRELAWTDGLLVFSDTPLQEALDQANRYFPKRLGLADPSLNQLRISGTLRSQSMETTLRSLDMVFKIVPVASDPDQILLGRRSPRRNAR